jgi:two-component system, NarL family, invasion response regulator UvrY
MIRVALVDDQELIRTGFSAILSADPEFQVVAEGKCGEDAMLIARKHAPDVMLLDISMPGGYSGVEALSRLMRLEPPPRVIMVSQHEDISLLKRLVDNGASGYVSKSAGAAELMAAIRKVMQGRGYVSNDLAQQLAFAEKSVVSPFAKVSDRELEVAISVAKGERGMDLAARLHISPKTVSAHKQTLMAKLGIKTDAELIKLAIANGLVPEVLDTTKL